MRSPLGLRFLRHPCAVILALAFGVPVFAVPPQAPPANTSAQKPATAPAAQTSPEPPRRPAYEPNAANEDWSSLKEPAARTDFWDPIKYIAIGSDRFITLSGEIRFRPEGFRIKRPEAGQSVRDNYLLQRYLFGADIRLGPRFRIFTEVQSGVINGRIGDARPTDRNAIDLHQGFLELGSRSGGPGRFSLRLGRQELTIGSSRLISASPGLNTKRSFDGARLTFGRSRWTFEGAAAVLTALRPGAFDDNPLEDVRFWAAAAARPSPRWVRGVLGFYYLGTENGRMPFAQGRGRDRRHTFGVAWRGAGRQFDLNYDLVYQTGSFDGARIAAWGVSTETGYRFAKTPWVPRVSVRVNSASGDKDSGDPRLQSFNPLFPGASYAGTMGLFGPTNMTDVTPAVTVMPRRGLVIGVERPTYWRSSIGDGLYTVDLRVLFPPSAGTGRHVGATSGVFVAWQATRHLQMSGAILRLIPGSFLKTTIARGGVGLYSISTTYRF